MRDILSCKEEGARRDVVLLNAAAAIFAADEATDIKEGLELQRGYWTMGRQRRSWRRLLGLRSEKRYLYSQSKKPRDFTRITQNRKSENRKQNYDF